MGDHGTVSRPAARVPTGLHVSRGFGPDHRLLRLLCTLQPGPRRRQGHPGRRGRRPRPIHHPDPQGLPDSPPRPHGSPRPARTHRSGQGLQAPPRGRHRHGARLLDGAARHGRQGLLPPPRHARLLGRQLRQDPLPPARRHEPGQQGPHRRHGHAKTRGRGRPTRRRHGQHCDGHGRQGEDRRRVQQGPRGCRAEDGQDLAQLGGRRDGEHRRGHVARGDLLGEGVMNVSVEDVLVIGPCNPRTSEPMSLKQTWNRRPLGVKIH
ncbi:uncharacterized protein PV07_07339 [Cladophialophora immunda]|uniref:Uncharacterized protein n=1 Tax=Cladophialophora immunda TaxID=569365 RepID=A0A0D2CV95_9EURO|nr:uncharacterized protein PV07_07339 [Cladophialophora immunda]KIW27614.1 hypothetical protein PV07_07339 [Cladophialophora immunda]